MGPVTAFCNIHWPSVFAAAVAAFVIGALWYSPLLFGNAWAKELKLTKAKLGKANMPLIFGCAFALTLIGAVVLDILMGEIASPATGLLFGLLIGAAFIGTAVGINYLFARKSAKLFFIDAGYFVVLYAVMGIVLAAW